MNPLSGPGGPVYPDRRSMQFRKAQREREAKESQHDKLCITVTKADGMTSCWCKCKVCWDPTFSRCICINCPCRAETIMPLYGLPIVQDRE